MSSPLARAGRSGRSTRPRGGRRRGVSRRGFKAPRSQTPFGNALAGETPFRVEGCQRARSRCAVGQRADTPAWETEFPSQGRSQTEFGNEGVAAPACSPSRAPLSIVATQIGSDFDGDTAIDGLVIVKLAAFDDATVSDNILKLVTV